MFNIQVFNPAPGLAGWHNVAVINDMEVGICFAADTKPTLCQTADHAAELAKEIHFATGARVGIFEFDSGEMVYDSEEIN